MAVLRPTALAAIDLEGATTPLGTDLREQLELRGLSVGSSAGETPTLRARIFSTQPDSTELAALVEAMAERSDKSALPWVFLIPPAASKRQRQPHAAAIALLEAYGAIVTDDPELFVEALVLLGAYGCPSHPSSAIVAGDESWLYAAALALRSRQAAVGKRQSTLAEEHKGPQATGAVFVDAASSTGSERSSLALVVPIAARSAQNRHRPALLGLDLAIQAVELAGAAAERMAEGVGPDDGSGPRKVDYERFDRQLDKCSGAVGDHECKVLLSSYGISITRQAVATTPSAATRIAKKAGYPVEMKPWGADQPAEPDGCPVHAGIATASEVRRSFSALCSEGESEAVIIRETPIAGKELRVRLEIEKRIGLMLYLERGAHRPPLAALAPLRKIDAERLAQSVLASRADDAVPDWQALAELLIRSSHLVHDSERVESLDLARVVVGGKGDGAVVVDASALLVD